MKKINNWNYILYVYFPYLYNLSMSEDKWEAKKDKWGWNGLVLQTD